MATNKKEAFRQYLEAAGVLDTITKSEKGHGFVRKSMTASRGICCYCSPG